VSGAPALAKIAVGIVVERRRAQSPWIDFTWRPMAALAGLPDAAPWTMLSQDGAGATFYAGAGEIALDRELSRQSRLRGADVVGRAAADRG
jgi:Protein of unknown function (DUF3305)